MAGAPAVSEAGSGSQRADERVPLRTLAPLAVQHLLVMISGPISSAFLLTGALHLTPEAGANLLAALFLMSGIGTALQSLGPWRIGARMPFVMLPGGAAVALFIQIAQAAGPATAVGAVLITGLFLLVAAPLFAALMRFFPAVVLGSMIIVIGLNLIKITAGLLVDTSAGPSVRSLVLAGVTVLAVVLAYRLLPERWRRFAVLLGVAAGTGLAAALGQLGHQRAGGPVLAWPTPLPFGAPVFSLLASLPLLLYAIGAMAEATGQTVLNGEAIGVRVDARRAVPRTIRGDAVTSLLSGLVGGPLMVTSGENIGIVRMSGVRSRYVTLGTAALLAVLAFVAPVARLIGDIPAPVVGGAGIVVFAMITVLGVRLLRTVDLGSDAALMTATLAILAGALPVVAPTLYQALPPTPRLVLGSGVTMAALVGVLANVVCRGLASGGVASGGVVTGGVVTGDDGPAQAAAAGWQESVGSRVGRRGSARS
ncbi:MAG TPA: solute carrier family 23 protein [Pseudonocardia sp.]|nr:solute carrier family 23 protein [Pseudonocardia sp.]